MLPLLRPRQRRIGIAAGALVALVLLLLSHSFGRAVPTNNYRPLITTDAIASGCYPLPGDAQLDLAYQVRWDEDVATASGERRILRGQYDLVDRDEAQRRLVASFAAVGFHEDAGDASSDAGTTTMSKGAEHITITVTELPDTSAETLVRGDFVLDLPVVALARPDDPVCTFPSSTKRWSDAGYEKRSPNR
ncbi:MULTISPECIES: hypothetical protein [unclassified Nocardioides]|uniref:hypothetical protein n=1 Tax=unclassified Nocardioides TaxID=2615069 RepID=UPI0007033ED4|nr:MULTISPECIES: hypothetical protein [unclassified Nocardioides]KRC52787.1 hypothetical protein ASE19_10235 [Nocardioides sp. Root79]KRC72318.1 hypothetical protein ASE20_06770 [Nocardioides sp. Root240]